MKECVFEPMNYDENVCDHDTNVCHPDINYTDNAPKDGNTEDV